MEQGYLGLYYAIAEGRVKGESPGETNPRVSNIPRLHREFPLKIIPHRLDVLSVSQHSPLSASHIMFALFSLHDFSSKLEIWIIN